MRCLALRPLAGLARVLARLPQRLLLALAASLAWLGRAPLAKRRAIASANLALAFPGLSEQARARLLRDNLRATLMGVLEMLRAWYAPARALRGLYAVEGMDEVRATLASGQGVLLVLSHHTTLELCYRLVSEALGRPVRLQLRSHNSACLEDWLRRARARHFPPQLGKKDTGGLLAALRAGELVIHSPDQDFSYRHAFVSFFGVPAATLVGTAALVEQSGARMFVLWPRRLENATYRLRFEPEWPGWREAPPEQAAAMYMRALEAEVRQAPEQYLWVHRRFKTRPPGEGSPYA
jgi:KDO2-lipid IV(A) lauroyltransferase